ncbi:MAG: Hypothetical protein BHV28_12520 [Candidatus Tokpelaia hoelldobleri]|uniref:DUF2062 domain-containing protein n=1 Tax=Candidatus Tokpelaia hoelldobleri TaxID=1902579 RepID=A0A1U9JVN2_9HYPH|nr:MAG: Hypothetical protein BHV28_12520 [Candidatus Tokpelaia hoelldoblerii]
MLFRRKKTPDLWERVRIWLWPRRSFARSLRYLGKRILRMQASPHAIALGLAIGIFAAFTPLYGFHIILAMVIAWLFSGSVASAAIGTMIANPLTIPLIFSATYALGRTIAGIGADVEPLPFDEFFVLFVDHDFTRLWDALLQLLIGSAVLGGVVAALSYVLAFKATRRFRNRRAARRAAMVGQHGFAQKQAG